MHRSDFVKNQEIENVLGDFCINDQVLLSKVDYSKMRDEDLVNIFRVFTTQNEEIKTSIAVHAEEVKTRLAVHDDIDEKVKAQLAKESVKVERFEQETESHKTTIDRHDKCLHGLIVGLSCCSCSLWCVR